MHRRSELRASRIMQDRAQAEPKIRFVWDSEVERIHGDVSVEGLTLRNILGGHTTSLEVAGVFVAIGHDPRSDPVRDQVAVDADGYVLGEYPTTHTSLEGVFACGDLVDKRYRQAITAAGTGCAAALDTESHLARLNDATLVVR